MMSERLTTLYTLLLKKGYKVTGFSSTVMFGLHIFVVNLRHTDDGREHIIALMPRK